MKLSSAVLALLAFVCYSNCQEPAFIREVRDWIQLSDRLPYLRDFGHVPASYEKWLVLDMALWLASRGIPVDTETYLYQNLICDLQYRGDTFVEFKVDNRQRSLGLYLRSIRSDIDKLAGVFRPPYRKIAVGVGFADAIWEGLPRVQGDDRRRIAPNANRNNYLDELRRTFNNHRGIPVHHALVRKHFMGEVLDIVITWAEVP
ncbi:MAG: hypothetical protein M1831_002753 [Alyxoria varia]|nr:MAG: hypothetical protein M1831_002753 [Alyxoria varia]